MSIMSRIPPPPKKSQKAISEQTHCPVSAILVSSGHISISLTISKSLILQYLFCLTATKPEAQIACVEWNPRTSKIITFLRRAPKINI